jgi:hypothetical protein
MRGFSCLSRRPVLVTLQYCRFLFSRVTYWVSVLTEVQSLKVMQVYHMFWLFANSSKAQSFADRVGQ